MRRGRGPVAQRDQLSPPRPWPGGAGGSRARAGDGRERLWRITAGRYEVTGVADLAPEGRKALHALLESLLAWDDVRVRRYLAQLDAEPPEWQDAAFFMDSTLQVTAAELTEVSQAVYELRQPCRKGRRRDLPPRTRPVSLAVRALPS